MMANLLAMEERGGGELIVAEYPVDIVMQNEDDQET